MATTYTSNYNLGKQEDKNDNFSMDVITENMDKIDAALSSHELDTDNPHGVTKAQIGLDNVVNVDTTTTANITDSTDKRFITDVQKTVLENTSGSNTGDETTSTIQSKLGVSSTTTDGYLTKEDFTTFNNKADIEEVTPISHTTNTSNPHSVTKAQVGLSNVVNVDTTTTTNITDSADKRFVTDAAKGKLTATTKTIIAEITDVIEALNWSATAPYTQNITLSVAGHTITDADYDLNVYRISNATEATDKLEIEAYSYIDKAVISADNTLALTAYDYKPLTDINVKIEVIKKW
jgi:hypothetical protein